MMKKLAMITVLVAILLSLSATQSVLSAPSETLTMYMGTDEWTINGKQAYILTPELNTDNHVVSTINDPVSYFSTGYWGIKMWRRLQNGSEILLTEDYEAVASKTGLGGETISTTFSVDFILYDGEALMIKVYGKRGSRPWELFSVPTAVFITARYETETVFKSTWTVYYEAEIVKKGSLYDLTYSFGGFDTDAPSRIENWVQKEIGSAGGRTPSPPWWRVKLDWVKQMLEEKVKSPVWNLWTQAKVTFEGIVSSILLLGLLYYSYKLIIHPVFFKRKRKWKVKVKEVW